MTSSSKECSYDASKCSVLIKSCVAFFDTFWLFLGGYYFEPGLDIGQTTISSSFKARRSCFEDNPTDKNFTKNAYTFVGKLYVELDNNSGIPPGSQK